jgi:hypothetical protein
MKKVNVLLLATLFLACVACSDEENLNEVQPVETNEVQLTDAEIDVLYRLRNKDNKVGIEEATRFANDVIGFLDGESAVKSGTARSISSIGALGFKKTQSVSLKSSDDTGDANVEEVPDTVAYVFNFGDEDGYAIISADTRIEAPILAYAGSGNLSDTIDNPGLILFLEGTEDYIIRSIADAEQKRDSLIAGIIAKLDAENELDTLDTKCSDATPPSSGNNTSGYTIISTTTTYGDVTTISHVYPLSPVEWGQGDSNNEPFWRKVRYKNCAEGTSPAGCVTVAIAHIMSYWKYPTSINGENFNWTELNKYTGYNSSIRTRYKSWTGNITDALPAIQTQAANLMENIGSKIGVSYGCGGSGANTADAVSYLRSIGYTGGYSEGYNYNTVVASLNKNQPVVIRGNAIKTTNSYLWGLITSSSYSEGHAWVIDGYLYQAQPVSVKILQYSHSTGQISQRTITSYNNFYYLHHNWGWHGQHNGYYVAGSFNCNDTELDSDTKSGTSGNFQYEVKIFPYIAR